MPSSNTKQLLDEAVTHCQEAIERLRSVYVSRPDLGSPMAMMRSNAKKDAEREIQNAQDRLAEAVMWILMANASVGQLG